MSLSIYIADNDADKERYEFKLEELHFDQKLDSFCVFSLKKSKICLHVYFVLKCEYQSCTYSTHGIVLYMY